MKLHSMQKENAEEVAIKALGFLAQDTERLQRFLNLSGIDPSAVRTAAETTGFYFGILDHLMRDESLLLTFSEHNSVRAESVASAHRALNDDPES